MVDGDEADQRGEEGVDDACCAVFGKGSALLAQVKEDVLEVRGDCVVLEVSGETEDAVYESFVTSVVIALLEITRAGLACGVI